MRASVTGILLPFAAKRLSFAAAAILVEQLCYTSRPYIGWTVISLRLIPLRFGRGVTILAKLFATSTTHCANVPKHLGMAGRTRLGGRRRMARQGAEGAVASLTTPADVACITCHLYPVTTLTSLHQFLALTLTATIGRRGTPELKSRLTVSRCSVWRVTVPRTGRANLVTGMCA